MTTYIVKKTRGDADDVDINSDDVDITAQPTYTVDDLFKRSYGPTIYPQDIYAKGPWVDVRAFGASGSSQQTTGSITAGEYELTLTDAKDFANGMGIRISGAGASGADLIAVVESGGGTTILTLATAASATVTNVTVEHDDSSAIQAAVDHCIANSKLIFIPPGTYQIGTSISITGAVSISGLGNPRGTILTASSDIVIFSLTGSADYSTIDNIKFLGSTSLGTGIKLYDTREACINRCVFDSLSIGVDIITNTEGAWYNNLTSCVFDKNLTGVRLDQAVGGTRKSNRNHFSGCTWLGSTNYHVYMNYGDTNYFMRCNFGSAPVMIYMNCRYTGFVGCCLEGQLADTDIWFQTTASGLDFFVSNCTLAHGVLDLNASTDCRIHSAGNYSGLSTNTFNNIQQSDRWTMGSASAYPIRLEVAGDVEHRGVIRADGRIVWGNGTDAGDTNLYRGAAGFLQTDDSLILGSATNGWLQLSQQDYVTIAAGAITPTGTMTKVETEGAAATDDLDTINGGYAGRLLILEAYSGSHDVVVKHGTGNIYLSGAADVTLDSRRDKLMLVYTTEGTWNALAPVATNG